MLSHFWSSFNFVLFLALYYSIPAVLWGRIGSITRIGRSPDSKVFQPSQSFFMLAILSFIAYSTFAAFAYVARYTTEMVFVITRVFVPTQRLTPDIGAFRSVVESIAIVLGQAVLVVFGATGFLARKRGPSPFMKILFVFGGIYVFAIMFWLPASVFRTILHRGFFFGFFAMAPVVAWTIHSSGSLHKKQLKAMLLILTVFSVVIMQEPWFKYPDFVAPDSYTHAASWVRDNTQFGSAVVPMVSLGSIFLTYGGLGVCAVQERSSSYGDWTDELVNRTLHGDVCDLLGPCGGHYVVLSSSTNDWLLRYYIERHTNLSGQEYVDRTVRNYGNQDGSNRVFSSGQVSLYYVTCR
jgi:hypothetical protein